MCWAAKVLGPFPFPSQSQPPRREPSDLPVLRAGGAGEGGAQLRQDAKDRAGRKLVNMSTGTRRLICLAPPQAALTSTAAM